MEINEKKLNEILETLQAQGKELELLRRIAPQDQLQRFSQQDKNLGKSVKVWTYKRAKDGKELIIKEWGPMLSDEVDYTQEKRIENQMVQFECFKPDEVEREINMVKGYISKTKDAEKLKAHEEKLAELESGYVFQMPLKDFHVYKTGRLNVKVEKEIQQDGQLIFGFTHEDQSYEINSKFVN